MKPIWTAGTNYVLGAPAGWDERAHGPCAGLPVVRTDDPYFFSYWRPSWREKLALLFGRPVRLCVVGRAHPPVMVDTAV